MVNFNQANVDATDIPFGSEENGPNHSLSKFLVRQWETTLELPMPLIHLLIGVLSISFTVTNFSPFNLLLFGVNILIYFSINSFFF